MNYKVHGAFTDTPVIISQDEIEEVSGVGNLIYLADPENPMEVYVGTAWGCSIIPGHRQGAQ